MIEYHVGIKENNYTNRCIPEDSCSGVWGGRKAVRPGVFSHDHKMIVAHMRTMEIREISLPFNPLNPAFILHKHNKTINKKGLALKSHLSERVESQN